MVYWLLAGCIVLVICITTHLPALNSVSHSYFHLRSWFNLPVIAKGHSATPMPSTLQYYLQITGLEIACREANHLCIGETEWVLALNLVERLMGLTAHQSSHHRGQQTEFGLSDRMKSTSEWFLAHHAFGVYTIILGDSSYQRHLL